VEHACKRHENDAKADERSPREPNGYGCAAEQAEVEPDNEIGEGREIQTARLQERQMRCCSQR